MNKHQIVKLQSNELVVTEAENNQASVDLIPAFAAGIVTLKGLNTSIRAISVQQQQSITGITTEKTITIGNLIDWTVDIAGGIHSYAVAKSDNTLREKVDFSAASIEHMRMSDLLTTANIVLGLLQAINPVDIAQYGISATDGSAFETALQTLITIQSSPREAIIDRSEYTDALTNLFAQAQDLLTNTLDKLATQFKRKDPAYYLKYLASRQATVSAPHKTSPVPPTPTPAAV